MRDNRLVTDIKSSLDIAEVIGQFTSLRRTLRGYSGLCPFHDEKTPSFHVYSDTQTYYCFSCHEAGEIFTFIMKNNGLTFSEAVEVLAGQAGIDLSKYKVSSSPKRSRSLFDVMNLAGEYFRECFRRLPGGKAYFLRRGFTENDAEVFGLGYAPDSWDGLIHSLRQKGVSDKELVDTGLVSQGERGIYDRFRGRLIFPVKDLSGRIIAFGGRTIAGSQAKYINSPESELYRKRSNLYLIDKASSKIRESGFSILCEGYMDALRLHKSGFTQAVASLGTSLTAEQAGLLKRFADRCYICYDTDSAGVAASIRGMYILLQSGLDVRVVRLPEGKDPDDFLSVNPPEKFSKALDESLSLIDFHIETLRPMLSDPLRRKRAVNELWEGVKKIDPYEALRYLGSLSNAFGLPHDEIQRKILGENPQESQLVKINSPDSVPIDNGLDCAFCSLLMKYKECRLAVKPDEIRGLLADEDAIITAEAILNDDPEKLMNLWLTIGDDTRPAIIAKGDIFLSGIKGSTWQEKLETIRSDLKAQKLKRRIRTLKEKLKVNTASLEEANEFMELRLKLQKLKI